MSNQPVIQSTCLLFLFLFGLLPYFGSAALSVRSFVFTLNKRDQDAMWIKDQSLKAVPRNKESCCPLLYEKQGAGSKIEVNRYKT